MARSRRRNLTSVVVTLAIIAMLILSQPSTALILSLQSDRTTYNTQETVTLTATIKIESGELLPIQEVRLIVEKDGSEYKNVSLPIQETTNQNVDIFTVTVDWSDNTVYGYGYGQVSYGGSNYYFGYGYGYGYGYGSQYSGSGTAWINYTIRFTANDAGSYTAKIRVKANGNTFEQQCSFSVSAPSAPTAARGAGGGGIVVGAGKEVFTAPASVTHSEARTIPANTEHRITLPTTISEAANVLAIVVKLPERMTLEVHVSKVESLPANVPKPSVDVYGFVEIVFRKYGTNIEVEPSGYVEFKVSKSWLAERGYDPAKVVLMKYHNGWKELKTEMVSEDANYYYYKAETGSFSIFAIAVKAAAPVITATPTPTPTPTVTPVITPTATPTVTPTATPEKPWWQIPGFEVILALIAITAAAGIALRKRQR